MSGDHVGGCSGGRYLGLLQACQCRTFRPRVETGIDASRLGTGSSQLAGVFAPKEHRRREGQTAVGGTGVQISHMAKEQGTLRLKCDGGTTECLTPSSRTLGLNPGKPSRRSPDALAVHARGDAAHDAHCPKPAHWKKHHRASKANPLLSDGAGPIHKPTTNAILRSADAKVV